MSTQRPRIGITCDFETITDRRGASSPRYLLQECYVDAVERAGGEPWLLPHLDPERAASVLDVLDGVVISGGGADVPPAFYGEEVRKAYDLREVRSAFERALVLSAQERDVPVLGVCGGMQILNVALGGSLHQDLGERPGSLEHEQPHDKRRPHHLVTVRPGTLLASAARADSLQVNSTHHQAVKRLGEGLVVSGVASDGVVEAIEAPRARFVLGVQWHPEALLYDEPHLALYTALVAAARARRQAAGQPR